MGIFETDSEAQEKEMATDEQIAEYAEDALFADTYDETEWLDAVFARM